ncbi:MAG: hypothetical protein IT228_09380 [Flavobacteriales bacterium]|nr:hypothetical protein [Flavobacteriales bacterium]MCC6577539.1 hypothetical protein [Flavobacteriales bacterium]NUQ16101.1 hypothetical protein [Flavobacteriales bacterium]
MRTLLLLAALLAAPLLPAQNAIQAMAIGNWRNGPVVYLTPVFATTEAATTAQLIDRVKREHPAMAAAADIQVMRFATVEEGEAHRASLKAKYGVRKLEVVLLDPPAPEAPAPAPATAPPPR